MNNETILHQFLKETAVTWFAEQGAVVVAPEVRAYLPEAVPTRLMNNSTNTHRRFDVGAVFTAPMQMHVGEVYLSQGQISKIDMSYTPENIWIISLKGLLSISSFPPNFGLLEYDFSRAMNEKYSYTFRAGKYFRIVRRAEPRYHEAFFQDDEFLLQKYQSYFVKYLGQLGEANRDYWRRKYVSQQDVRDIMDYYSKYVDRCRHDNEEWVRNA